MKGLSTLVETLNTGIRASKQVVFSDAGLGMSGVDALLSSSALVGDPLRIKTSEQARLVDDRVELSGLSSFLNVSDMPTTATFSVVDGELTFRLEAQCPNKWPLDKSFPQLKPDDFDVNAVTVERFILLSKKDGSSQNLQPGLNLVTHIGEIPILTRAPAFFGGDTLPGNLPLEGGVFFDEKRLDIELKASVPGSPKLTSGLPALTDGFLGVRFYSTCDDQGEWSVNAGVFLGALLQVGKKQIELLARLTPGGYIFLQAEGREDHIVSVDDLSGLLGGATHWQEKLPGPLRQLGDFSLNRVLIAVDVAGMKVGCVGLDVGLNDWTPMDGLTIRKIVARWMWYPNAGSHHLALIAKSTIAKRFDLDLEIDDQLIVTGRLRIADPVPLAQFLAEDLGVDFRLGFLGEVALDYMLVRADVKGRSMEIAVGAATKASLTSEIELEELDLHLKTIGSGRDFSGRIGGTIKYKGLPLALDFEVSKNAFAISASAQHLNLSEIVERLAGINLPAEIAGSTHGLPDIELSDIELSMPETGAFSLRGKASGQWSFALGGAGLSITDVDLSLDRAPDSAQAKGTIDCAIKISGKGPLNIAEGFVFESFNFAFTLSAGKEWALSGDLAAQLFGTSVTLNAKYSDVDGARAMCLSWSSNKTTSLLSFEGVGSLGISSLEISSVRSDSGTQWRVAGDGHLAIAGVLDTSGRLELEAGERKGLILSELSNAALEFDLPLVPTDSAWKLNISTRLQKLSIIKQQNTGWALEVDTTLTLSRLPGAVGAALPEKVESVLRVGPAGVSLAVERLLEHAEIALPEIDLAGTTVSLGTTVFDIQDFTVTIGKKPSLSAGLKLGLPHEINYIFGTENGKPRRTIINDQISFKLGLSEGGLFFEMLTPLIKLGKVQEEAGKLWQYVDLGDIGEIKFVQPVLEFNGSAFNASGEFQQVRPLGLPLGFLKTIFGNAGLSHLADATPSRIPLTEIRVLHDDKLDVDGLLKVLGEIGNTTGTAGAIKDLKPALQLIASRFNELPVDFREYLEIVLPDHLKFDIAITPGAGLGITVDIATDAAKPLKLLMPTGAGFTGVKLWRLSIGEIFGGSLVIVKVDAEIDAFDLLTLAAIMAFPTEKLGFLPDPTTVHRRFVARNLHMVVVMATGVPIPIPVFYDDLGLDLLGLEGLGLGLKLQFPEPKAGPMDIVALLKDMWPFFSDKDVLLDRNILDKHNLGLQYSIDPAYVQVPKYVGGKQLGSRDAVLDVGISQALVDMLNTLKRPRLGRIVRLIPLEKRVGADDVSFGPMTFDAAWAVTTDAEFSEVFKTSTDGGSKFMKQLGAIPPAERDELVNIIKFDPKRVAAAQDDGAIVLLLGGWHIDRLVDFEIRMGLAQSVSMGYGFGFGIAGDIGKVGDFRFLDFEARGSIVINVHNKTNPVLLDGHGHITLANHQIFKGDIQLADGRFQLDGVVALFPDGWPVKVGGRGLIDIRSTGEIHLLSEIDVALTGFTLIGSKLEITNHSIELRGTWLGVGAGFNAIVRNGAITLKSDVGFHFVFSLDIGPIAVAGVKLTDRIALADTGLEAMLATELGKSGFSAEASASFKWKGDTWTVPSFGIHTPPIDADALLKEFTNQIEKMASQIFRAILGEAATWASATKSGAIELAEDVEYVGKVLDKHFKQTADEAAKTLKDAGYVAEDVGRALTTAFNKGAQEATAILRGAGYAAEEVGRALSKVFGQTAQEAAIILRSAGYAAEEVGRALSTAYNESAKEVLLILKAAGYGATGVAGVMKNVFNYSATQVAQAMKSVYHLGDQATKGILQGAGYAASAIDSTMKDVFNWGQSAGKAVVDAGKKAWNTIKNILS